MVMLGLSFTAFAIRLLCGDQSYFVGMSVPLLFKLP